MSGQGAEEKNKKWWNILMSEMRTKEKKMK